MNIFKTNPRLKLIKGHSVLILFVVVVMTTFLGLVPSIEARKGATSKSAIHLQRHYKQGGQLKYQKAYYRPKKGKWTKGHFKTSPDGYKWNNKSEPDDER